MDEVRLNAPQHAHGRAFVESVARELEEFAKTLTVHAPLLQQKCDKFLSISSAVLGDHCSFILTPDRCNARRAWSNARNSLLTIPSFGLATEWGEAVRWAEQPLRAQSISTLSLFS